MNTPTHQRILMVDDHDVLSSWVRITQGKLQRKGFVVDHVTSAEDAMQAVHAATYDIAVIDIDLQSAINGLTLLRQFRGAGFFGHIILVTGDPEYLEAPLRDFRDVFTQGPISFVAKNDPQNDFVAHVADVSSRLATAHG